MKRKKITKVTRKTSGAKKATKKAAPKPTAARRPAGKRTVKAKAAGKRSGTAKPAAQRTMKAKAAARRTVNAKAAVRKPAPARREKVVATMAAAATPLSVKEALEYAIRFEHQVRDHYANGAARIQDPQGAKVFAALAREEQGHIDYLEAHLAQIGATGATATVSLKSALPTPEWVRDAETRHRQTAPLRRDGAPNEIELLKMALQLESDATTFYHDLVRRLPEADRPLFEQFLNIEDGHLAIVQSELDSVQGIGYWFDVPEFALEAQ